MSNPDLSSPRSSGPLLRRWLALAPLALLAACGAPAPDDGAPPAEHGAPTQEHGAPLAACAAYPIPVVADPGSEVAARADLATLSPSGQLTWHAQHGTLSSLTHLNVPLPACTSGADTHAVVRDVIAAHGALFQIDLDEWQLPVPFDCRLVTDRVRTLRMDRDRLGGHPVRLDVFTYALRRIAGVVTLQSTFGTYLPPVDPDVGDAMTSCRQIDLARAIAAVQATPLSAPTFNACVPTGETTYKPRSNDRYVLRDDESWLWTEDGPGVRLFGAVTLRVTLDPANHTPALLQSAARCPVFEDPTRFTVGFDVRIDLSTGQVVSVKPGLDCIVC